jgi:hypothetical protein
VVDLLYNDHKIKIFAQLQRYHNCKNDIHKGNQRYENDNRAVPAMATRLIGRFDKGFPAWYAHSIRDPKPSPYVQEKRFATLSPVSNWLVMSCPSPVSCMWLGGFEGVRNFAIPL